MSNNEENIKPKLTKRTDLQEGLHYYFEGGFMVLTETYHLERGYCCGKGCRHCPYSKNDEIKTLQKG